MRLSRADRSRIRWQSRCSIEAGVPTTYKAVAYQDILWPWLLVNREAGSENLKESTEQKQACFLQDAGL